MYSMRTSPSPYSQTTAYFTMEPMQYQPTRSSIQSYAITPHSTTRRVNPALSVNHHANLSARPVHPSRSLPRRDVRAEIDDSPIIDPRAFQYLNQNERKSKKNDGTESGIDSRPIINLDAVALLERRRQQQLAKNNRLRGDDGTQSGIDDRSIVDMNAFRYLESKSVKKSQDQTGQSGIDDRPITNPDAFK